MTVDFVQDNSERILGDNIFYGADLPRLLKAAAAKKGQAVFGYCVGDLERYGKSSYGAYLRNLVKGL